MKIEYEVHGGTPYLVLYIKKEILLFNSKRCVVTEDCPFCGGNHVHGYGVGHRLPHCDLCAGCGCISAEDGTMLSRHDGYILKFKENEKFTANKI